MIINYMIVQDSTHYLHGGTTRQMNAYKYAYIYDCMRHGFTAWILYIWYLKKRIEQHKMAKFKKNNMTKET